MSLFSELKLIKIVLRGEDGMTEHAQGLVDAEKYSEISLVERNKHFYRYDHFTTEHGRLVMLFNEINLPLSITEF